MARPSAPITTFLPLTTPWRYVRPPPRLLHTAGECLTWGCPRSSPPRRLAQTRAGAGARPDQHAGGKEREHVGRTERRKDAPPPPQLRLRRGARVLRREQLAVAGVLPRIAAVSVPPAGSGGRGGRRPRGRTWLATMRRGVRFLFCFPSRCRSGNSRSHVRLQPPVAPAVVVPPLAVGLLRRGPWGDWEWGGVEMDEDWVGKEKPTRNDGREG